MLRVILSGLALASLATAGSAHFSMFLPSKPWAEKGEKITFTYQFGHPFEHELDDAPKPAALRVFNPRGATQDLDIDKTFVAIKKDGADGKKVTAWQFDFTPTERGDYTFALKTAFIKHEKDYVAQDMVRVTIHVQTQNGWNLPQSAWPGLDILPFTRPYGLLAGMTFKGRVLNLPVAPANIKDFGLNDGLIVEIEKYNAKPPKLTPPDELITFQTKTDGFGFFVSTLPEPGWWCMTAKTRPGFGTIPAERNVMSRATYWVHVDEKK